MIRTIIISNIALLASICLVAWLSWPEPTLTTYDGKWCYYDQFSSIEQARFHLGDQPMMIDVIHTNAVYVYLHCKVK